MQAVVLGLGALENVAVVFGSLFLLALTWAGFFRSRKVLERLRARFPAGTVMASFLASDSLSIWSARITAAVSLLMLILLIVVVVFFPVKPSN